MISFFVAGIPVPKGSAKAFMRKGMKHPVVIQDNADKQKPWASAIGYAAQQLGASMISGPVELIVDFIMPRPLGHFGTGKNASNLKLSAPMHHVSKPDLDKLVRCVKDALTGVVWKDDSQVSVVRASKVYGETAGVGITIDAIQQNNQIGRVGTND